MSVNYAVAPGDFLREWLEESQLHQSQLADKLGISRKLVNGIINGRDPVTADTADRLEKVTGIPEDTWLKYEACYQGDRQRLRSEEDLAKYADRISPQLGKYMRDLGVTQVDKRKPGVLVADFLRLVHFGTMDAYEAYQKNVSTREFGLATLRESAKQVDTFALSAWLAAGSEAPIFQNMNALEYDDQKLRERLGDLRERACSPDGNMVRDIQKLLLDRGVVLLIVQPPSKFPLFGATRWYNKKVPIIQQTLRQKTDGHFVWTLFHEIGHILNDEHKILLDLEKESGKMTHEQRENEKRANNFASLALFGEDGVGALKQGFRREGLNGLKKVAQSKGIPLGVAKKELCRMRVMDYKCKHSVMVNLGNVEQAEWALRS